VQPPLIIPGTLLEKTGPSASEICPFFSIVLGRGAAVPGTLPYQEHDFLPGSPPSHSRTFILLGATMSFETLGLNPDLLRALSDLKHDSPTPIQRQTIPPIIEGRDVLGVAQTGSGKTGGFLLPSLHRNKRAQGNRTRHQILVLSPTRELAGQIERSSL
ncbi:protein containing DNA/RNA helicase, DEAD/DEAH box type, partial [mine drainage metagenome]